MLNRVFAGLAILAGAFLIFLAGSASSFFEVLPGRLLHPAYRAADALYVKSTAYETPYATNLWQRSSHDFSGVGRHDPEQAQAGYTLYTSGNKQGALLIDMRGNVAHEWQMPFYDVWPNPQHLDERPNPEFIVWRKAMLWPNGDIIALYIAEGITPWGMGVVKLAKDSSLIWRYPGKAHHDIDIGPDGQIYLLTHELRSEAYPGLPRIEAPYLDDRVVILDADGQQVADIGILDAFMQSAYRDFLPGIPKSPIGDYLHANAVEVVTREMAEAHLYAKPGDILISMRQPGVIALIDPVAEQVTWARRGPWIGQHDPDFLANGNMLIFDNRGRMAAGGISRVQEFDPLTGSVVWEFHGTPQEPFWSGVRSGQQRLPNGNTLITESDRGRLLEVSSAGDIVWEYVNPETGGPDNAYRPVLTWGERYLSEELDFLNEADEVSAAEN